MVRPRSAKQICTSVSTCCWSKKKRKSSANLFKPSVDATTTMSKLPESGEMLNLNRNNKAEKTEPHANSSSKKGATITQLSRTCDWQGTQITKALYTTSRPSEALTTNRSKRGDVALPPSLRRCPQIPVGLFPCTFVLAMCLCHLPKLTESRAFPFEQFQHRQHTKSPGTKQTCVCSLGLQPIEQ